MYIVPLEKAFEQANQCMIHEFVRMHAEGSVKKDFAKTHQKATHMRHNTQQDTYENNIQTHTMIPVDPNKYTASAGPSTHG
jgi:hypothetical protein